MYNQNIRLFSLVFVLLLQCQLTACGGGSDSTDLQTDGWPIASKVFTTAERQILPVAVSADTPWIPPGEVSRYAEYGYSSWKTGPGLSHEKRAELAPSYTEAPNAASLLSFVVMTDIHLADKESPAQPIYIGLNATEGPQSAELSSAYSPILLSTIHVLDAAVQTINTLHKKSPFDFLISLGDDINNNQHNELRWFIDTMDGQVITPSSGAHAGADTIDYQKPFKAAGLDKSLPWYQVLGNHDQLWMGTVPQNAKSRAAHVGDTILNIADDAIPSPEELDSTGAYMGVVDGTTPYGDIIGAGPEENFPTPPKVVADPDRRALATPESSSLNWMSELFNTTSNPVGHGFNQTNLEQDFTSYSFEPKAEVPIKIISLDDTCKGPKQVNYAMGCLDQARIQWLTNELQRGQDEGKLMIIAAHVPIKPQKTLIDTTPFTMWSTTVQDRVLALIHSYPNVILWISGHRHMNVVTAQPYNAADHNDQPERSFWMVETASLRDFPQQFRTFDIRRNNDGTVSIIITNVDPAVSDGSPAAKSRGYAIGAARIFGSAARNDTTSHAYNAELVIQLTPEMQAKIANYGSPIE